MIKPIPCKDCITLGICKGKVREYVDEIYGGDRESIISAVHNLLCLKCNIFTRYLFFTVPKKRPHKQDKDFFRIYPCVKYKIEDIRWREKNRLYTQGYPRRYMG